ncbi:MAG TPA: hypothetical protein VFU02_19185 [Polyangiaceae bacterium]|nr:hypothetical protein [Polyangiaceae bacterium]
MRKLTRFTINVSPALVLAGILAGSFPACGGGDEKDDDSTLPDTTSSGGASSVVTANNANNTSNTGVFTTGSGGETSSSSTGEGGAGAGECGGQLVDADPVQVNLLLVIDRSGSMNDTADGFEDDKWTAMVDSLDTALDGISGQMSVGLQFFPDASVQGDNGCGVPMGSEIAVPIGPGADAVDAVKTALDASENAPSGNTPAAAALSLAHDYFTAGPGADLEGENYVLLAIDGGPNCNSEISCGAETCTTNIDEPQLPCENCCDGVPEACLDDDGAIQQVEALTAAGITTFVVGIPGSDQPAYQAVLDVLAERGGAPAADESPKYYQVTDASELSETLISLTSELVTSCELALHEVPPDLDEVNVFVNDEVVPKLGDDGWEYDHSTTPPTIVIKGETCATIESQGVQSVLVEFGCPTIEIPK